MESVELISKLERVALALEEHTKKLSHIEDWLRELVNLLKRK